MPTTQKLLIYVSIVITLTPTITFTTMAPLMKRDTATTISVNATGPTGPIEQKIVKPSELAKTTAALLQLPQYSSLLGIERFFTTVRQMQTLLSNNSGLLNPKIEILFYQLDKVFPDLLRVITIGTETVLSGTLNQLYVLTVKNMVEILYTWSRILAENDL